jgi:glycosyltransferase involved in cell wall biosynthesis
MAPSDPAPPRVTVLIGCWNAAPTLRRAIDSILSQTVTELELIVVDDGSTDETPQVVAEVKDPRVRHLQLEHMGISRSLNRGVAEARAPVVATQDADDWSLPHRLERQLAVLDAWPRVAVVGARMSEVDEATGRELRPRTSFAAGDLGRALMRFNPIPNTVAAFRRAAFERAGGYDESLRYAMDYDLWLRIADQHAVYALDEVLAVRVMGSENFGASNERPQTLEAIRARLRTMRRRGSPRGATGLVLPSVSYLTPIRAKRVLRRRLDQAP